MCRCEGDEVRREGNVRVGRREERKSEMEREKSESKEEMEVIKKK